MSFVHLHTHSEYSLLDGANRIGDLIERAQTFEMPALALTDHGCMFGAWEFQEKARKAGLKPIVGMEAYVAPGDRRDRSAPGKGDQAYYHLVLLARDAEGYRNLVKLTSIGYMEGFYRRPRIDREVLERHSAGVIVSSACMAGEVSRHLLADRWEDAREAAAWYAEVFRDRYYLEVQCHTTPGQKELNERVLRLAGETGIPVVATNDAHFLRHEDHDAHDVLLCIGLGKDRTDQDRMRYNDGLYFKSPTEVAACFPDRPDVVENTLAIADSVNVVRQKQYHVPRFPLPANVESEAELMRTLTYAGARQRFGETLPPEVQERLDFELDVITDPKTNYSGYFLITADFINWAKDSGIPVGPGRGSAAGSLVAYALRITDVDPLRFDLLFERFLNPDRVSMPDIDIDFCYERRGEVIEYVRQKYGKDSVGQIITFGTMKSRAVIRDVGRVLGFEPAETDRLAKLVPNAPNNSLMVAEAVQQIPELRALYESDTRVRQLLEYAKVLEGLSRHASVHAAGVVIAPGPVDDYVPVCTQPTRGSGASDEEAVLVTQWDMNALEQAGMLKMDFLGLKTLTVINDAVVSIREKHGKLRHPATGDEYAAIEDVPLDDPAVYDMLARGGTTGVFQFESSLATDKLRAMKCDQFEDLVATNALIRPGPLDSGMTDVFIRRKLGRERVEYALPELEIALKPTYGVITYQEQVMRIAQILAGFTLAEADVLRKAVGKKDAELINAEIGRFVERAIERGYDAEIVKDLGEQIATFGRYGFNRSHSVAYALLSYQTAWLKCHYPAEFMAALLSAVLDKTEDVVSYIAESRELGRYVPGRGGLEVLPPDVNESGWKFTPVGTDQIRFGLGAIRGLGAQAVQSILTARAEKGPFTSLFDLATRVDLRSVGRRSLEALIQAGACDGFGHRAQLMAAVELVVREAQLRQEEVASGQGSLFDALGGGAAAVVERPEPQLPEVPRWTEPERLAKEKELLGFFISGHPLERFRDEMSVFARVNTANLAEHRDQPVELACVVTAVSRQISKKNGAEWARITVEDFSGTATALVFGDVWERYHEVLAQDAVVLLCGTVSGRDRDEDAPPLFLDSAVPLAKIRSSGSIALELCLAGDAAAREEAIQNATRAFQENPGKSMVFVEWTPQRGNNGDGAYRFRSRLKVSPSEALMTELRSLFGADRVRLVKS